MITDFLLGIFSGIFLTSILTIIQQEYYTKQIKYLSKKYYSLRKKYNELLKEGL